MSHHFIYSDQLNFLLHTFDLAIAIKLYENKYYVF